MAKHTHIFEGNRFGERPWLRAGPFIFNAVHIYVLNSGRSVVQGCTLSPGQLVHLSDSYDGKRHYCQETIGM